MLFFCHLPLFSLLKVSLCKFVEYHVQYIEHMGIAYWLDNLIAKLCMLIFHVKFLVFLLMDVTINNWLLY